MPLRSFPKSRKALFDVALAGPLVGLGLSIGLFLLGLVLTPASFADPSDAAILRYTTHTLQASSWSGGAVADCRVCCVGCVCGSGAAEVLGDIVSTAAPPDFPTLPISLIHQVAQ